MTLREVRLASNPRTVQEELLSLCTHPSLAVKRALAQNPNSPPQVLVYVGRFFPKCFVENPSVPLLLIEDPEFLRREESLMLRLLRLRELPEFLWVEAARHTSQKVRMMLADSRYTPPRILAALLHDTSSMVQRRALSNPMTPSAARTQKKNTRTIGDAIAEMSENLGYSPYQHQQVQRALATMPTREAIILQMCFGLREDGSPRDTKPEDHIVIEIGQDFEIVRERMRAISAKALRQLKHPAKTRLDSEALRKFIQL